MAVYEKEILHFFNDLKNSQEEVYSSEKEKWIEDILAEAAAGRKNVLRSINFIP